MYLKLSCKDHIGHQQGNEDQQRSETKLSQKGKAAFKA